MHRIHLSFQLYESIQISFFLEAEKNCSSICTVMNLELICFNKSTTCTNQCLLFYNIIQNIRLLKLQNNRKSFTIHNSAYDLGILYCEFKKTHFAVMIYDKCKQGDEKRS